MRRIHIVGASPRTGTTLMAEAIVACFEIDCHNEHEQRIFVSAPDGCDTYLSKCPKDVVIADRALSMMPDLYMVYMVRDPRNIVTSKHGRDPGRYWAGLKFWKTYTEFGRRLMGHPRFISVRYEDLTRDPDGVQEVLMQRMPFLVRTRPFSSYHEFAEPSIRSRLAMGGLRAIAASDHDRWKDHLPRLAGQLELHGPITDDLIEFGYEHDDAWLESLAGVEPDTSPGRWAEFFTQQDVELLQHWGH